MDNALGPCPRCGEWTLEPTGTTILECGCGGSLADANRIPAEEFVRDEGETVDPGSHTR